MRRAPFRPPRDAKRGAALTPAMRFQEPRHARARGPRRAPVRTRLFPRWLKIGPSDEAALVRVLHGRSWGLLGDGEIERFEARFAKHQQARYAVAVANGTAAPALWARPGAGRWRWRHATLIGCEPDFLVTLQPKHAALLGLAPHEVVLRATHTHSGPAVIHRTNCGASEADYVVRLRPGLLALAVAAPRQEEAVT